MRRFGFFCIFASSLLGQNWSLNGLVCMEKITENYIDIKKILANKGISVAPIVVRFLNRLLHIKELNSAIYDYRDLYGVDFSRAAVDERLAITTQIVGSENIPLEGHPIVAGNHPLGGPDGMALINAIGRYRRDVRFPVNDFLMYLPGLRDVFVPIDKVHHNGKSIAALEEAFAGENILLYFPAGVCSRRQKGVIKDLEWKPTFIKKAVQYQRDIVPVYFDAKNRNRFYTIANLRKRIGIKFNFEMALLPGEMFAQKGKTFRLVFGEPIPWQTFDSRHSNKEWAQLLKEHVYQLKDNPTAKFQH